jgi:aryl-alcohol dehydrogenase-like predicted oxidoreductase
MTIIAKTELDVFPLNLGGNVFGWTADEETSFTVLDAYAEGGGNFIDTADSYGSGQSEEIIGRWLAARGNRDRIVVATKVARMPGFEGLSAANIAVAAENSLRRLGVDHIDLYYAHFDDLDVPIEETLGAFNELVTAGKVRYLAASNLTPQRLTDSLAVSRREGLAEYVALQPHYNLVERDFETTYVPLLEREGMQVLPYFALAKGFLTGKYRDRNAKVESPRAKGSLAYLDDRGERVLAALDRVSAAHGTSVAAVALAWLAAQPTVVAPIASARSVEQLNGLLPMADLKLTADELDDLTTASA